MSQFNEVSGEVRASWEALACQAREALHLAGLPAYRRERGKWVSGAGIDIYFGSDENGGVYVGWHTEKILVDNAEEPLLKAEFGDPAIRHLSTVTEVMQDAMITILRSAGFQVEELDDDMALGYIRLSTGSDSSIET